MAKRCQKHNVALEDFGSGSWIEMDCHMCRKEHASPEEANLRTKARAVRRRVAKAKLAADRANEGRTGMTRRAKAKAKDGIKLHIIGQTHVQIARITGLGTQIHTLTVTAEELQDMAEQALAILGTLRRALVVRTPAPAKKGRK